MSRVKLEKISYAKANNKYMNDYDPETLSTFITYLDIPYLPYGGFRWLKNVDEFGVMSISKKRPIRYFLEVDLKYTDELHELQNDYPLALEKLAVSSGMLSNYCKDFSDKYKIKIGNVKNINSKFR